VVERLPRKHKALGSGPSSEKKNQKKKIIDVCVSACCVCVRERGRQREQIMLSVPIKLRRCSWENNTHLAFNSFTEVIVVCCLLLFCFATAILFSFMKINWEFKLLQNP